MKGSFMRTKYLLIFPDMGRLMFEIGISLNPVNGGMEHLVNIEILCCILSENEG
jgi:hypothetical protein